MSVLQALVVVLVIIAVYAAAKYAYKLFEKEEAKGHCVSAVANVVLAAGGSSVPVACCTGPGGACAPEFSSAYGAVVLVPTALSPACPSQALTPAQYAPYLSSLDGNTPGVANVEGLAGLYTAGHGCGDIQVGITRLCSLVGSGKDLSTCRGGIAAVQGPMTQTVSCPGGLVQATRRVVMPGDLSKATCQDGGSDCCTLDLDIGRPVPAIAINATKDGVPTPCAGQPLTELLYYQCVDAPGS